MLKYIAVSFLLVTPALAQQQFDPRQNAYEISRSATTLAELAVMMQQQLNEKQKQIDALRDKCGDPCKDIK
jgi:hypothetical protein